MRRTGLRGHARLVWITAPVLAVATMVVAGCDGVDPAHDEEPEPPPGSETHTIVATDGTELRAHLWPHDPSRIVIYLHGYLSEQTHWWPHIDLATDQARTGGGLAASALTLDFRGHGGSRGDADAIGQMVEDARAAVAWVRERDYESVTLVGAGMGAAVAMEVAHAEPEVWVIGLSTPSEFGELSPIEIAPTLSDRLALLATEGDLSAAHSLEVLVEVAGLPAERWRLLPGRVHGVEMLTVKWLEEAREFVVEMLEESWARR